jgi:hypothetical protein
MAEKIDTLKNIPIYRRETIQYASSEFDPDMEAVLRELEQSLAGRDSIHATMGFTLEKHERFTVAKMPSVDALNGMMSQAGHYDRAFARYSGGSIDSESYLRFIAGGTIPVAQERGWFGMHDTFHHGPGFLLMPDRAFQIMKDGAADALASGDEARIGDWTEVVDSNTVGEPTLRKLTRLYGTTMGTTRAAMLAAKDMRVVRKSRKELESTKAVFA